MITRLIAREVRRVADERLVDILAAFVHGEVAIRDAGDEKNGFGKQTIFMISHRISGDKWTKRRISG
jgi:hypothetical protein